MITTILPCDQCRKIDITAELPGKETSRLCPVHYAIRIGKDINRIRGAMQAALRIQFAQAEKHVPKSFDNVMVKA
jgi:hypothetical protein